MSQRTPADIVEKICNFVLFTRQLIADQKLTPGTVYGMDGTAVWLDPSASTSIAPVGVRDVSVHGTGYDKLRITVALTAKADGKKFLPFVLLNRKGVIPEVAEKLRGKPNFCWAGRTWMDESLTETYLRQTIGPQLFNKRLLVWDSFMCHISSRPKEVLGSLKILTSVVPGGCTKFVQPADLSWNKLFKQHIQEQHDDWLRAGDIPQIMGGNCKPVDPITYLTGIYNAWQLLSEELIRKSFKH